LPDLLIMLKVRTSDLPDLLIMLKVRTRIRL